VNATGIPDASAAATDGARIPDASAAADGMPGTDAVDATAAIDSAGASDATGLGEAMAADAPGADGAGTQDAAGGDADDDGGPFVPLVPAPPMQTFFDDTAVFLHGGTIADPDTGYTTTVTLGPSGARTISTVDATGLERVHIDWTSLGASTMTAYRADGTIDESMTTTSSGNVVTTVWQLDKDLDGTFDWRSTTQSTDRQQITQTIEELSPGAADLTVTSTYTGPDLDEGNCQEPKQLDPLAVDVGASCDALALTTDPNYSIFAPAPTYCNGGDGAAPQSSMDQTCNAPGTPPCIAPIGSGCTPTMNDCHLTWSKSALSPVELFASAPVVGSGLPIYAATSGPMACTKAQRTSIARAVQEAFPELAFTLIKNWTAEWTQLLTGITNQSDTGLSGVTDGLYYACAMPPGVAANDEAVTIWAGFSDANNAKLTMLNPSLFDARYGLDALEEIVTHELMHAGGYRHQPAPDGGQQRDYIYSCARIADGCRAFDEGFYLGACCDASSSRDAAMCAGPENKAQFGVFGLFTETKSPTYYVSVPPTQLPDQVCYASGSYQYDSCLCSIAIMPAYCDHTPLQWSEWLNYAATVQIAETMFQPQCCEACPSGDNAYSNGVCGTQASGSSTTAPPGVMQSYLPQGGTNTVVAARAPTVRWRSPIAAIAAGEAMAGPLPKDGGAPNAGLATVACSGAMLYPDPVAGGMRACSY
jgi:hypothetical protein